MRKDDIIAPLTPHQIARFLDWLESQAARHYEQRTVLYAKGRLELAYHLKLEAHTYERVLHAFLQSSTAGRRGRCPAGSEACFRNRGHGEAKTPAVPWKEGRDQ